MMERALYQDRRRTAFPDNHRKVQLNIHCTPNRSVSFP
jgi:hypothetical protein